VDFGRIEEMLHRIKGRIDHAASTVSARCPAPTCFWKMGRVPVKGQKLKNAF